MKVLFVAKCDYSGLAEGMVRAFTRFDHDVNLFDLSQYRRQAKYLGERWVAARLKRCLESLKPELVFIVAPLFVPLLYCEVVADYRRQFGALCVGWIGDLFRLGEASRVRLAFFDRVYYTDTGFASLLSEYPSAYLPLATDPSIFSHATLRFKHDCVFVAARTVNRESFLMEAKQPVKVFGPGWKGLSKARMHHNFYGRKLTLHQTARLYNEAHFVLNLKNADNVINGLNQRSFDPCACRTPLLHDMVGDLGLHFEPGRELLAFSTPAEFDAQYNRVCHDASLRTQLAENAYRRVLACHTYNHRAETVLLDLQLSRG